MSTSQIIVGDALEVLRTLPDESVNCIVTSPPYWGLRDYGVDGQIGLEGTLAEFLDRLVAVFRECRRVLRSDGVAWVNMGDSYAGGRGGAPDRRSMIESRRRDNHPIPRSDVSVPGLKPKDLVGQPWRLAFALQDDGWYLRQDVIWHKPNPMPESTSDRCTKAHEYLFLLTKSARYWWDKEAMQEPVSGGANPRVPGNKNHSGKTLYESGDEHHRTKAGLVAYAERARMRAYKTPDGWDTSTGSGGHGSFHKDGREKGRKLAAPRSGTKQNTSMDAALVIMPETRNRRSVWTIPSEPNKDAHFATFPTALVRPCILASCPVGGTVLDPFSGTGTTVLVANELARTGLGSEINPEYAAMAQVRIAGATAGLPLEAA